MKMFFMKKRIPLRTVVPLQLCQVFMVATLAMFALPMPMQAKDGQSAIELARQLNEAFIDVAEKVSPAVVVVEVAHKATFEEFGSENPLWDLVPPELREQFKEEYDKRRRREQRATPSDEPRFDGRGSGIVIREDGYILTNTHVVEGAEKLRIKLKDGRQFEAKSFWTDPQSDIAVMKIDAQNLATAKLGDSSKTRVGEFAIAIGAPFDLDYSVTFGHVSAKGRTQIIPSFGLNSLGASMDQDFIQTDASINPGNSGGPLVNIDGEVIGINTLIRGLRSGIGFAIPSNLAKAVSDQLISEGKFVRAWLGISVEPFKESNLRTLYQGVEDGLVVREIQPEGPAIKSELEPSDIILAIEGHSVASVQQLRNEVRAKKVGSELTLDVLRPDTAGKLQRLKVTVKSAAWSPGSAPVVASDRRTRPEPDSIQAFGLTVAAVTKQHAETHGVEMGEGVIVMEVKKDGAADRAGFKPGDVITKVNRKKISTVSQFRDAAKESHGKSVLIHFISDGAASFRILTVGSED
jgi:serine protease Do